MALAWHCYCRKQFNTLKDSTVLFINILCSLLTPYWLHPFLIISSCLVKSICNKLIMQSNVLMLMQSSSLVWDYLFAIQKYLLNTHHHSMQDSLINVILLRVLTVHCVYEMMLQKNIKNNVFLIRKACYWLTIFWLCISGDICWLVLHFHRNPTTRF
jgi:hypothetical protein